MKNTEITTEDLLIDLILELESNSQVMRAALNDPRNKLDIMTVTSLNSKIELNDLKVTNIKKEL
jgi:hypothetical protein